MYQRHRTALGRGSSAFFFTLVKILPRGTQRTL
jgi:hypothetical protein